MASAQPSFTLERNAAPVPVADRAKLLADPGFGRVFTDHMAVVRYTEGKGWHDARITARKPLTLDPAAAVLHYAQEVFEGLKAYRLADGTHGAVPARRQCAPLQRLGRAARHGRSCRRRRSWS